MALIHHASGECASGGFELFDLPPTAVDVQDVCVIQYHPINTITASSPLEFQVASSGSDYFIDLDECYLNLQVKVTQSNGDEIKGTDKIAPVNNFLHSLFQQVDLDLNEVRVSSSDGNYGFKAYIENLLSFTAESKFSLLCTEGWYADTAGKFSSTAGDENDGFKKRREAILGGKTWDLMGKLHLDWFLQQRYLLNSVDIRLRFIRQNAKFALMCGDDNSEPKIDIVKAVLYVKKVKPSSDIILAHSKVLAGANAKYFLKKVECKAFTVPSKTADGSIDSAIVGALPSFVVVGLIKNSAYTGNFKENPFEFQHFDLSHIALVVDGKTIPHHAYTPDFDNNLYVRDYLSLYTATGRHQSDKGLGISFNSYKGGNILHAFDLSIDQCSTGNHLSLARQGSMRVELKFRKALTESVTVLLYCAYQTVAEIDKNRNVSMD